MKNSPSISLMNLLLFMESYLKGLLSLVEQLGIQLKEKTKALEAAQAEIRKLKNLPKKPKLTASKLDENPDAAGKTEKESQKRAGSAKRNKKSELKIHKEEVVQAADVPTDWQLVGYKDYVIQDLLIQANNIAYQREVWQSPDGQQELVASLPVHLQGKHFGATLKAYILHQYNECAVSQPLIASSLADFGIDISTGQINRILIENKEAFHQEKLSLLEKAIELKEELRTDDTGARHQFKNGYCNCINSDLFTYFTTTYSKSRINFLEILNLERGTYVLNQAALDYIQDRLPISYYNILSASYQVGQCLFEDKAALLTYYEQQSITAKYAIKAITEGLLVGSLISNGFEPNTLIHSDGAGQFALFNHSLCWKHAERPLRKLTWYNDTQQSLLADKKKDFWLLYQALKKYKAKPEQALIPLLTKQFDQLCEPVVNFDSLNQVLVELKAKKDQLLLVLTNPKVSLHNNDSERDIREYAKRRKISAGTRSENGRKARDTFLSLKKTCKKLGISFWEYLLDRLQQKNQIPPLSLIMQQKAVTANV